MTTGGALAFRVHGMDCAEEVKLLERALAPLVGGRERLAFDVLHGKLVVDGAAAGASPAAIQAAVAATGMRAEPWRREAPDSAPALPRRRAAALAAATLLAAGGLTIHAVRDGGVLAALGEGLGVESGPPTSASILYLAAIVLAGAPFLPRAWRAARALRPDMHLLMTVAVVGAVGIGDWFEAATVTFLFALSLVLEAWSVGGPAAPSLRSSRWRRGPCGCAAPMASSARWIPTPCRREPASSSIRASASASTARSYGRERGRPGADHRRKRAGRERPRGHGLRRHRQRRRTLEVDATRHAGDTTLAHIMRMVGEAQSRRAPSERWVEAFARVYTPAVLALAVVVAVVPPLVGWRGAGEWFYRALVLLVIACPCALVISTPVTHRRGDRRRGARTACWSRAAPTWRAAGRLRAIAFDKTGTLTARRARGRAHRAAAGHEENELVDAGGRRRGAQRSSDRPRPAARGDSTGSRPRRGRGPAGCCPEGVSRPGRRPHALGRFASSSRRTRLETPAIAGQLAALAAAGRTVLAVGDDDHVCGFITVADRLRPGAAAALAALRAAGVAPLVMLTGDNAATAAAIAADCRSTPSTPSFCRRRRSRRSRRWWRRTDASPWSGDGVNDAPALAAATVGIAMGAAGSDAVLESADVALMADELGKIPWLVLHSRRTLAVVRQNIAVALGIKLLFVTLTVFGWASLWAAIAADMGASLLVTANGLRLLRARELRAAEPRR